jgi:2'-5' RNA ligase
MSRYAVYAIPGANDGDAPEALRLRQAVDAWYARDDVQGLTADARRYGFHATLKAPFRLAAGRTEAELRQAADDFAAARNPVMIPRIRAAAIGGFRALLPYGKDPGLDSLAADVVRRFEEFRAPLGEADIRRRRPERLTQRQRELLDRWGYPYVLEEFRFHLTLTDDVPTERAPEIDAALEEHFADVAGVDVPVTSIVISVEPEPGAAFRTLSVHPFIPSPSLETA